MKYLVFCFFALTVFGACTKAGSRMQKSDANNLSEEKASPDDDDENSDGPNFENSPFALSQDCSVQPTTYVGFGDRKISLASVSEEDVAKYRDRFRLKPYDVLGTEYQRVTGILPESLAAARATFAAAPARWYSEPQHSSITLFTVYGISYEAALKMARADPSFNVAPDAENSITICASFAEKAWNIKPLKTQLDACANIALVETARIADVQIRWAHALASILTASNFLAY